MWTRAEGLWLRFDAGLWDELLDETARARRVGRGARRHADRHGRPPLPGTGARSPRRCRRRRSSSPAQFMPALARSRTCRCSHRPSWSRWSRTRPPATRARAVALAEEFDAATAEGPTEYRELYLPEIVRVLVGRRARPRRRASSATARCTCGAPGSPSPSCARDARRGPGRPRRGWRGIPQRRPRAGKRGVAGSSTPTPWPGSRVRSRRSGEIERGADSAAQGRRHLRVARRRPRRTPALSEARNRPLRHRWR